MKNNKIKLGLALDGGGCNGLYYLYILAAIEKKLNKRCYEIFDIIGGTSIGSIIGAMLASGMSVSECIQFFMDYSQTIFTKKWYSFGLFSPIYDARVIERVLRNTFKGKKLKDCKTRLLIPSYNLTKDEPFFFKSYLLDYKDNFPLWIACRASSSAQLYFKAFQYISNGDVFWDGGNTTANNPSGCILADSIKINKGIKNIKILSLGCGNPVEKEDAKKYVNCGAIRNLIKTFSTLFSSGSLDTDYQMKQILGDNFLRINPQLKETLGLDAASYEDMQKRHEVGQKWTKEYIDEVLEFLK